MATAVVRNHKYFSLGPMDGEAKESRSRTFSDKVQGQEAEELCVWIA